MLRFIKSVLKTGLSLALAYCLLLVFAVAGLWWLLSTSEQQPQPVRENSMLVIDLSARMSDSPQPPVAREVLQDALEGGAPRGHYLLQMLESIRAAAADPKIAGIFLHGSLREGDSDLGIAGLRELRQALLRFRKAGKPIVAHLESPGRGSYYLASVADSVHLAPFGALPLNGLMVESPFFGEAFDRYGVGVQVVRAGRYKSAVEPFVRKGMSAPNREQLKALIEDAWSRMVGDIAASRDVDPRTIARGGVQNSGMFDGKAALEAGLIDRIAHFDQTLDRVGEIAGRDPATDTFNQVSLDRYARENADPRLSADQAPIAVVYAHGEIVDGEWGPGVVGADWLARELRDLREDDAVEAVVLRVNSPGGSALAAETIHRELALLAEKKTLVASFGRIAASGGYWIATPAETIFADPATVTGSIGVFGLLFNIDAFANRFGVTFDRVQTGPYADIFSMTKAKSEDEVRLAQRFVDKLYNAFRARVRRGRDLPRETVKELAQGRVHSGHAALANGLADRAGGLAAAIDHAAKAAGADGKRIRQVPSPRTRLEALADMFGRQGDPPVSDLADLPVAQAWTREYAPLLRLVRSGPAAYARLPFDLRFQLE